MNDILEKIKSQKRSHSGHGNGIRYSTCEMRGWRNEMEDEYCAEIDKDGWCFFGIFDGHGGNYCSQQASKYIWRTIKNRIKQTKTESLEKSIINAIKEGFVELDDHINKKIKIEGNDDKSGTTVVAALITDKKIFLINCGDSRGLLVRNGTIEIATFDHKPTQLKEKQRIQNAGGMIALNRVNGCLATSRGIGDFEHKEVPGLHPYQQFVSCEPDIYVLDRHAQDDFIILACDGIWDVKDNQKVCDFLCSKLNELPNNSTEKDLEKITNELVDSCFDSGSKDNMSAVLIHLNSKKSNDRPSSAARSKQSNDNRIQDVNQQPSKSGSNSKQNNDGRMADAHLQSSRTGSNAGHLSSRDRKDPTENKF